MAADLILYRALHPAWSFAPLSGDGAAKKGGRWNRPSRAALYLACDPMTALAEYNQDIAFHPVTLGEYHVSGANLLDSARVERFFGQDGTLLSIHNEPWYRHVVEGKEPPQWRIADRVETHGYHGLIYPSAQNSLGKCVVLWRWNDGSGAKVRLFDPESRLPAAKP